MKKKPLKHGQVKVGQIDPNRMAISAHGFMLGARRCAEERPDGNGTFEMLIMPQVSMIAFAMELYFKAILTRLGLKGGYVTTYLSSAACCLRTSNWRYGPAAVMLGTSSRKCSEVRQTRLKNSDTCSSLIQSIHRRHFSSRWRNQRRSTSRRLHSKSRSAASTDRTAHGVMRPAQFVNEERAGIVDRPVPYCRERAI